MTFLQNLEREKQNEHKIAQYLMSLCAGATFFFTSFGSSLGLFDFGWMFNNKSVTVELKTDYLAHQTRNLFLEMKNSRDGSKSGIARAAIMANRAVYYLPQTAELVSFDPREMLSYLDGEEYKRVTTRNAEGFIVPLATVKTLPFVKVLEYVA